jgi:hypothetical protein
MFVSRSGRNQMMNFEARIWEKAEHWYFDITIEAKDEQSARAAMKKDYPARSYSIKSLQSFYRPEPK